MPSSPTPESGGPLGALPGFIALSDDDSSFAGVLGSHPGVTLAACGPATMAYWNLQHLTAADPAFALSRVTRTALGEVSSAEIASALRNDPASLTGLLPPFAAVSGEERGVIMVADSMGFRQLYHSAPDAAGRPTLSTSALLAARARSAGLDHIAVAVQSLLGWQLGQRTLFSGVDKLAPGAIAHLGARGVTLNTAESATAESSTAEANTLEIARDARLSLEDAVALAAPLLQASLNALLDDHPEAVLQLTGGQDSRLLLSAVPAGRRRGLRAMTLGVPGSGDVTVASQLAERYGMRHEVHGFAALDNVSAAGAWGLALAAATRLDAMSDPIALAALTVAEGSFDQGVRISGLGGEIARGFYYMGAVRERPFTPSDSERLAAWRMFANESVEPALLDPEFSAWARAVANDEVVSVMAAAGDEWFHATDELYLRHRMQRWAGVTDTAVGEQRIVINPMLCQQFLRIASRVAPGDKAHSLFLARLQMELDPELGRIPLEGRPAPIATAHPSSWRSAAGALSTGRRLARKVGQRIRHTNRAPAGGFLLAAKVVEHWRAHPEILAERKLATFIRADWIEDVLAGRVAPRPSSVAFLTNLIVASRGFPQGGDLTRDRRGD